MSIKTKKKNASYLDAIGSGYESDTVKEYDPATEEGQIGKAEEEKVTEENAWEDEQHDEMGMPLKSAQLLNKKRRLARKLRRIAAEIETLEKEAEMMDEDYQDEIESMKDEVEDMQDDMDENENGEELMLPGVHYKTKKKRAEAEDLSNMSDEDLQNAMGLEMGTGEEFEEVPDVDDEDEEYETVESSLKTAETYEHPIDYNPMEENPEADMDAQTGDDEWIDIGPGIFDDKRNEMGMPVK